MASQLTSFTSVYSTVYSGADQRKHQSSASLAFVRGMHWWPVNSPHKWPVTRKTFPFDDVIMLKRKPTNLLLAYIHWDICLSHVLQFTRLQIYMRQITMLITHLLRNKIPTRGGFSDVSLHFAINARYTLCYLAFSGGNSIFIPWYGSYKLDGPTLSTKSGYSTSCTNYIYADSSSTYHRA